MIPIELYSVFMLASILLALSPGPDNLFVLTQSALHGRKVGWLVTLGLCTGLLVHTTAVVIGVAALLKTSATAFAVLKLAGAVYLLWLAWQMWRATTLPAGKSQPPLHAWQYYRRGIIMNVTNPKVTLFFLAFLPQFTDPAWGGVSLQLISLGLGFIVATVVVFGSIAMLAGVIAPVLQRSARLHRVLHGLAAVVFVALAIRLLVTSP
jgi:threonine/homoserine/homoserine lactone efflux protein